MIHGVGTCRPVVRGVVRDFLFSFRSAGGGGGPVLKMDFSKASNSQYAAILGWI